MEKRISKERFYLNIAKVIAIRSPCISRRQFGAVLYKDGAIIATGYAGTVRGAINCGLDCKCIKDIHNEESVKTYNYCPSVHAEMNVIINAARNGISTLGSTLYLGCINNIGKLLDNQPCYLCRRFIIQAGIKDVYYTQTEEELIFHENVSDWLELENKWISDKIGKEK